MSARTLAGVVVLAAIVLTGPVVVAGEPAATPVLAAKPDKAPPAEGGPTAMPEPPTPSTAPGAPGGPGWARETKGPVLAAFGALGILGGSVVVFAAVQRRRRADEHSDPATAEIPPPFAPSEAQLAALESDPLMAALNRRSAAQTRAVSPDAPAWVRRMKGQGQTEDHSGEN